ncbi:hypothetical protein DMJ13_22380 [halophilic archaeon]|nr:hypothetical protein DMJ13_22380 [halophilic archaeon]
MVEVIDAETVKVKRESGETMVVTLLGIQTPGTNASASQFEGVPSSKHGRQLLATIHKRALQTTHSQLGNQVVTVVTDPAVSSSDGQQRAYVYVGEFMYNTQLLRTGYAQVSGSEFSKRQQFLQKQQTARQKGYGLWGNTTA